MRATSSSTKARPATHQWYDGTPHPWEFKRVWHLEPSLTDPDTVYAGVEDAALFRTTDGGESWQELAGLRGHESGKLWQPGAGGMCLHTILLDPTDPKRIYIAISAAGAFRTDDGGKTWKPINRGLKSQYELPDPNAEVGHCVHRIAMHPSRPGVLFMQKHWDVMRSDDAGDIVARGQRQPADRLRLPHRRARPRAGDDLRRADQERFASTIRPKASCASIAAAPAATSGSRSRKGLPQSNCYVNVLRDAMAVDTLDRCGVYFGTTGGQVYASADGGDTWTPIVRDLPAVLSVEVQTLP